MGYPAAVYAENAALAWAYVESKKFKHRCHLFDILPDCEDGMASELLVQLFLNLEMEN